MAQSVVAVGTTSTRVIGPDNRRLQALFMNDSDTVIYLRFGIIAVAGEGIRLAAGGSYEMSRLLGNLFDGAVNAIHGGVGNKNLLVTIYPS